MYFYEIGYGSYEDSCYTPLVHTNKFSKEELENMFVDAVVEYLINREKGEQETKEGEIPNYQMKRFMERAKKELGENITYEEAKLKAKNTSISPHYTKYSYIHDDIVKIMVKNFGFEMLKYDAQCFVSGWADIVDKSEDSSFREDHPVLNKIAEKFWSIKK
jgi:hypothetical protein